MLHFGQDCSEVVKEVGEQEGAKLEVLGEVTVPSKMKFSLVTSGTQFRVGCCQSGLIEFGHE